MIMGKNVLAVHGLSVLVACCLLVYLFLLPPQIAHVDHRPLMSRAFMGLFAGICALTGFSLMARRRGKSESVVLAASTLVSALLLIIAAILPVQVL
jgi:hypothetical protein